MFPYLKLFGLNIPMYGLMMALAFVAAILVAYFRTRKAGLSTDKLLNIAIISILSGIVGAFLLYLIVTPGVFKKIINAIVHGDFKAIHEESGFVFYGGLIGGVVSALIYCKAAKLSFSDYVAVIAPVVPLAHAIGRVGCFCAGCCYGREIDCALSVIYTNPIGGAPTGVPVFPIQLLESVINLIVFAVLLIYSRKRIKSLTVMFLYFILYAIERFSLEFLRADEIRGIFLGVSTSQWISIAMFAIGVVGFTVFTIKDRKKALFAAVQGNMSSSSELPETDNQAASEMGESCEPIPSEPINGDKKAESEPKTSCSEASDAPKTDEKQEEQTEQE